MGGWEHQCCGQAIEPNDVVDLDCLRIVGADGLVRLMVASHLSRSERRVRGRVRDIEVLRLAEPSRQVLRVPSGLALRGFDPDDDGHIEDPWSGELLSPGQDFLVTIRLSR